MRIVVVVMMLLIGLSAFVLFEHRTSMPVTTEQADSIEIVSARHEGWTAGLWSRDSMRTADSIRSLGYLRDSVDLWKARYQSVIGSWRALDDEMRLARTKIAWLERELDSCRGR